MNISDILIQQSEKNGDKPCFFSDNAFWSYRDVDQATWQIAAVLYDHGVRCGSVVAHMFQGEIEQLLCMMATARLGATVFSVPVHTPSDRQKSLLHEIDAAFIASDLNEFDDHGLQRIPVVLESLGEDPPEKGRDIMAARPEAPWIIVSGSGSTGRPKFMPILHAQQWERMQAGLDWLPYTDKDVFASMIRLDFYASKQRYLEAFAMGATIALDGYERLNFHRTEKPDRVTVLYGTVFHIEQILASLPEGRVGHLESLQALMVGGATVTPTLREKIRSRLCSRLYVLYGANECHTTCRTNLEEVYGIPGNVGRPHKGFRLEVVGPDDKPLPAGESGNIRITSKASIEGYLHDDDATAKFFRKGWFYPGDLGRMTRDGQLIHLGRADDLMIMNGINIYPAEIEQVMGSHPGVQDSAVVPLTHEVHQDIPVCAVVLEESAAVTTDDLLVFARERLGASSPYRVVILDAIPRNEQGKPVRTELKKMIHAFLGLSTASGRKGGGQLRDVLPDTNGRQLTVKVNVSFIMPEEPDIAALDRWIDDVLDNDLRTDHDVSLPGAPSVPDRVRQWLWRCLQLSRLLLQAGRVPIFDPPLIRACSRKSVDSRKWTAVAEFALIDDFPKGMYEVALQASFSLAAWAMAHEPTGKNLDFFFKRIQERIVEPLYKVLPVGKSTYPVLKAVHEMGIPFRHLGGGVFQLGWGANARRMDRSTTEKDSAMGAKLSHNKVLATRLLWSAGLPAAVHSVVRKYENALGAARQIGWPVVIKPADRDRGEGVTIGVSDEQALKNAFEYALEASQRKEIIVERMVPGVCHRFFVSNGKLLYAVKRLPMSVVGDGKRSVEKLVADEYELQQQKPPWKRTEIRSLDQLAFETIAAAGMTVSSVPQKGEFVPLRPIESTLWGGIDEEVTDRIHPENLRVALEAASVFGLHVAGIDIISNDITKPWYENGAIVNEVNYSPLFGGGEISRRHIPYFIREFMQSDGTVPVTVFAGGDRAWDAAVQRWKTLVSSGRHAVLTDERRTIGPSGQPIAMPFVSLYRRMRALTLSSKVEAIIPVVRTDEFLDTGLPLEFVDAVSVIDEPLISFSKKDMLVTSDRCTEMKQLLTGWDKG